MTISKAVLITGCSTGIGRATAVRLAKGGYPVYATARKIESIADLAAQGCTVLALDVCDEASMRAAVAKVEEAHGAVGVLVNNAGYGSEGPVEEVPMDEVRRQFDTNVFGLLAPLPARAARHAPPALGQDRQPQLDGRPPDASRRRLLPRDQVRRGGAQRRAALRGRRLRRRRHRRRAGRDPTEFGNTAIARVDALGGSAEYAAFREALKHNIKDAYDGRLGALADGPEAVAKAIERAMSARRPRTRYVVTAGARLMIGLRRWLPDRAFDAFLRTQFPVPGK